MIGCLRTRIRKQPIIALYFESETVLKFNNLEERRRMMKARALLRFSSVCVCVCVCVCGHFILYLPLFLEVGHSDFFVCSAALVDTEKHTGHKSEDNVLS